MYSNSTITTIYKSREQQWVPKWHLHNYANLLMGKLEEKLKDLGKPYI